MSVKDNRREVSHYNDSLRSYCDVEVDLDVFENGSISTNLVHLCSSTIIGQFCVIVEPFCTNEMFVDVVTLCIRINIIIIIWTICA